MSRETIDLNADAGESYGAWRMGRDEELFGLVTSVNLACGFHAGDPATMLRSVRLARERGVAIGAHPGLPDKVGFGRREMKLAAGDAYADVLYQLGALAAMVGAEERLRDEQPQVGRPQEPPREGLTDEGQAQEGQPQDGQPARRLQSPGLHHVKPHGALYMQMTRNEELCRAVAAAVRAFAEDLPLIVLAGSKMEGWAGAEGTRTVAEAFPDRGYLATGLLAPRTMPGSLVLEPEVAAERAQLMARGEPLDTIDGGTIRLEPATLCIHGDNPESVEIARAVREGLEAGGIEVGAF